MAAPSRQFLTKEVLPWIALNYRDVLFVGAAPYTCDYERIFERANVRYVTIDVNPSAAVWGSKLHVAVAVQEVDRWFEAESFDCVILNGVFGFGVNTQPEMEKSLEVLLRVLKP